MLLLVLIAACTDRPLGGAIIPIFFVQGMISLPICSQVEPSLIREALRSSLAVIDGMIAELGPGSSELNLMVSNGDQLVAVHRSQSVMSVRVLSGKGDADAVIGEDPQLRRKIPELSRMHFTIAASDFDDPPPNSRWKVVPDCAIVTMSRDEDPRIEAL